MWFNRFDTSVQFIIPTQITPNWIAFQPSKPRNWNINFLKIYAEAYSADLLRQKWNRHDQQRRLPTAIKLTIESEHDARFFSSKQLKIYSTGKSWGLRRTRLQISFPKLLLFLTGGAYVRLRREATEPYNWTTLIVQFSEPQLSSQNPFPFPIMHRKAWKLSENNCKSFEHCRRSQTFTNHCNFFWISIKDDFPCMKIFFETSTQHDLWTSLCKSFPINLKLHNSTWKVDKS